MLYICSKAWLAARVSLRLARLPRTASSAHWQRSRRLRQSFSRTLRSQKYSIFSTGPKLRYLTVQEQCIPVCMPLPLESSLGYCLRAESFHCNLMRLKRVPAAFLHYPALVHISDVLQHIVEPTHASVATSYIYVECAVNCWIPLLARWVCLLLRNWCKRCVLAFTAW